MSAEVGPRFDAMESSSRKLEDANSTAAPALARWAGAVARYVVSAALGVSPDNLGRLERAEYEPETQVKLDIPDFEERTKAYQWAAHILAAHFAKLEDQGKQQQR